MGIFFETRDIWLLSIEIFGMTAGLLLDAYIHWKEVRARRVSNSFAILDQYQQIWREPYQYPILKRVLYETVDLEKQPVCFEEEIFVTKLVLLLSTVHRAVRHDELTEYEGLPEEAREFFKLPIPKLVWEKIKKFQDREFIEFIEQALK